MCRTAAAALSETGVVSGRLPCRWAPFGLCFFRAPARGAAQHRSTPTRMVDAIPEGLCRCLATADGIFSKNFDETFDLLKVSNVTMRFMIHGEGRYAYHGPYLTCNIGLSNQDDGIFENAMASGAPPRVVCVVDTIFSVRSSWQVRAAVAAATALPASIRALTLALPLRRKALPQQSSCRRTAACSARAWPLRPP